MTKWKRSARRITKVCDGIVQQAIEDNMTDMSKKGTALQDSANASKRNVKDRLMGSRAKLASGCETFVVDDNVRRALCHSALDSASFPAPD